MVTVQYKDFFDGNKQRTEDLYFNINAFELAQLAADFDGDLGAYMRKAFSDEANYKDGFKVLKALFVVGYGRREERDGRIRFIKKPEWVAELLPSPEFEKFYLDLSENATFASNFWNGLVSEELLKRAKLVEENEDIQPQVTNGRKKFSDMTLEEQVAAMRTKAAANGVSLDEE